jgi:hypothetical protein
MTLIIKNPNVTFSGSSLPVLQVDPPLDPILTAGSLFLFDFSDDNCLGQAQPPLLAFPSSGRATNLAAAEEGPATALMPSGDLDLATGLERAGLTVGGGIVFDPATSPESNYVELDPGPLNTYLQSVADHSTYFSYTFRLATDITPTSPSIAVMTAWGSGHNPNQNVWFQGWIHSAVNKLMSRSVGTREDVTGLAADTLYTIGITHERRAGEQPAVYVNGTATIESNPTTADIPDRGTHAPRWGIRPTAWDGDGNAFIIDGPEWTLYRTYFEDLSVSGRTGAQVHTLEQDIINGTGTQASVGAKPYVGSA